MAGRWKLPLSLSQADSRNFYFGSSSATPWCNDLSHKNHVRSENKIALQHRKVPTEYKVRKMCNECIKNRLEPTERGAQKSFYSSFSVSGSVSVSLCLCFWLCLGVRLRVSLASLHTQIHTHSHALSFSLPVAFPFLISWNLFISQWWQSSVHFKCAFRRAQCQCAVWLKCLVQHLLSPSHRLTPQTLLRLPTDLDQLVGAGWSPLEEQMLPRTWHVCDVYLRDACICACFWFVCVYLQQPGGAADTMGNQLRRQHEGE